MAIPGSKTVKNNKSSTAQTLEGKNSLPYCSAVRHQDRSPSSRNSDAYQHLHLEPKTLPPISLSQTTKVPCSNAVFGAFSGEDRAAVAQEHTSLSRYGACSLPLWHPVVTARSTKVLDISDRGQPVALDGAPRPHSAEGRYNDLRGKPRAKTGPPLLVVWCNRRKQNKVREEEIRKRKESLSCRTTSVK